METEHIANEVMLIGEKETFLIRVLIKKLNESGFSAAFVPARIDDIAASWDRAAVATYYLDNSERVKPDVMHFLNEKLGESDKRIILVGEKNDAAETKQYISETLILETFLRPLDTDAYISCLNIYMQNIKTGGAKRSILIIDDDPNYMNMIRGWLKNTYKVSMVTSGAQALTWLGTNTVDLILLDYEMPVTDGPMVLKMLRSDPDLATIPVFFLTGKSDKASVMNVMDLKPENYLLKSIERDKLMATMRDFFGGLI